MMFSAFQTFGKLGAMASSVARAWSPLALWPDGIDSPGMWIDPSLLTASFNDYTGTTPVATPGAVADSANPVGLALDIRAGATSVTDPGNHMLQATSAARPLESGRVNQLTFTEDFSNAAWDKIRVTLSPNAVIAPDGTLTADTVIPDVTTNPLVIQPAASKSTSVGAINTFSIFVKKEAFDWLYIDMYDGTFPFAYFNISDGTVGTVSAGVTAAITPEDNGFYRLSITVAASGTFIYCRVFAASSDHGVNSPTVVGTGVASHDQWGAQFNRGGLAPYQSVPGGGSTYDPTGITPFQLYDGIDDGMATASFAAGALINGMDCMIAVRRDSGANCVAGLYNGIADATKFFGMAESASGSGCVGSGAGTPTVWVDGVQLSGGTAVTRGTLHTALTVGDWHILEFRGLDMSTWTAAGFGLYTSYVFPGARGDILLYPSTASTEDKDAARQYLADYYGVRLP